MMRLGLIYLLLFAVLLPSVSSWGTIAYYQVNKAYIARVLCENRDKPQLHCDGKCYLAKKLKAQQDKQDKETTERVESTPTLQLFLESGFTFDFVPAFFAFYQRQLFQYLLLSYDSPVGSLLHPPCQMA